MSVENRMHYFFLQSPPVIKNSREWIEAGNEAGMKLKRDTPLITDRGELRANKAAALCEKWGH